MFKLIILSLLFSLNSFAKKSLTELLAERSAQSASKIPPEVKTQFAKALQDLKETDIEKTSVRKGTQVPFFKIDKTPFKNYYSKKPVILKFYRGAWCPYCQIELKHSETHKASFEAKGYQVVILTPDTPKEIANFRKKHNISLPIYQDQNNHIAKRFGIAFKLSKKIAKIYSTFGINLKQSQGNSNNQLPLPGTYVINTQGQITYVFADVDYTKRLDPLELLKAL